MGREEKKRYRDRDRYREGKGKSHGKREEERDEQNQDKDIEKNEEKGRERGCLSLSVIGVGREKDRKGWRITMEAMGPRENSVLGRWGKRERSKWN